MWDVGWSWGFVWLERANNQWMSATFPMSFGGHHFDHGSCQAPFFGANQMKEAFLALFFLFCGGKG